MALNSKIIIIKPEKTQDFLYLNPNSEAIEKAKKTMEKNAFLKFFDILCSFNPFFKSIFFFSYILLFILYF